MRAQQINRGEIETKTLAECLKVDFGVLFQTLFPKAGKEARTQVDGFAELGILKRMEAVAELLLETQGPGVLKILETHASDTARGWGAFVVGKLPDHSLKERFKRIQPYADDSHFGVREWAWMALRSQIAEDLEASVKILSSWTQDKSPRVRRFASEATRPRGVWAAHIQSLKDKPEIGLPILAPLNADPEKYVQDSVANWLNDAAKSQPKWVQKICQQWEKASKDKATAYIVKRALRSFK